jgi:hypothetical protein
MSAQERRWPNTQHATALPLSSIFSMCTLDGALRRTFCAHHVNMRRRSCVQCDEQSQRRVHWSHARTDMHAHANINVCIRSETIHTRTCGTAGMCLAYWLSPE